MSSADGFKTMELHEDPALKKKNDLSHLSIANAAAYNKYLAGCKADGRQPESWYVYNIVTHVQARFRGLVARNKTKQRAQIVGFFKGDGVSQTAAMSLFEAAEEMAAMDSSSASDSESNGEDLSMSLVAKQAGLNSPQKARKQVQSSLKHWRLKRHESAAHKLQRRFRRKKARRARAINRISAWFRGKKGRTRALRAWELQELNINKHMQCMRWALLVICYTLLAILSAFAIFLNLIFGIKFSKSGQVTEWVHFTLLTILIDLLLYSPIRILCRWVMPLFLVFICYVIFFFGVVSFAIYCDGELDEVQDLCEFLPF